MSRNEILKFARRVSEQLVYTGKLNENFVLGVKMRVPNYLDNLMILSR